LFKVFVGLPGHFSIGLLDQKPSSHVTPAQAGVYGFRPVPE
jgi:hypothetical protein